MNYQGGKFRQSKHIAPIINQCIKENSIENYYEPFCGGLNVLDKIQCSNLYANDIDEELISFYQFIHEGGQPLEDVAREEYYEIKNSDDIIKRGNIKYMASFGGKPWGGWGFRRDSNKSHYAAALNNFKKQIPAIKRTSFSCSDYQEIVFKDKSFIYLDPPYKDTTKYGNQKFDYEDFYEWAKQISKANFVIISEYTMPEGFTCFKTISYKQSLAADTSLRKRVNDNLYYCEGLFKDWFEHLKRSD